ncbi:hypothetical protein BDM02DRAFT_3185869 [Thelephora ganbajun]|uniref:Uncharacterized protein n=1 Tax=Thelephora ganbajun TaxID=370292 RepID=A0ACB6ZKI4_THEGA|nr:hypothetical protein BDM02DRAFT_3185869 [Thelephora ganbajun]
MLLVFPATSAVPPTSDLAPQSYDYYPRQGYYPYHDASRFAVPFYPSQLDFFHKPSAEELEEHEYRRALDVVTNHRRRQAEKEAAIRRQQLAEAARHQYFAALAAKLEQRRQEELIAAHRAEFIHSQRVRARLVAAERQHLLNPFLRQLKGPQPVTRQPHVVKHRPLVDALKQRLTTESDADISESIRNVLSSLEPRPVELEKPKDPSEDPAKLVENLLSSIFSGLAFHTQPQVTPSTEKAQPSVSDKGKGKARAVAVEEPQKPVPKPKSADEAFADILRHVMELSRSTPAPQSPEEAGPSGSSPSSSPTEPAVTEREQAQIDRAIALSSVEKAQSALAKLQTGFVLPTELDYCSPSTDDHDETASVSSVSSSGLTKLIPYTSTNKPVYKYENELNGLLEELDRIDSHGDAEVREKRKQVVRAVEKALEGVGNIVGEMVEKRLSIISTTAPGAEEPLKGFDVEDVAEEVAPPQEQIDTPAVVDGIMVSVPSSSVLVEETVAAPVEASSLVDKASPESDTPVISEATPNLPGESTPTEPDIEASTATVTPASVEPTPATETEPPEYQVQADVPETVDTFLLPEKVSLSSPVQKPQQIDSDTDEEVLVLDSDAEKSDWSELEH